MQAGPNAVTTDPSCNHSLRTERITDRTFRLIIQYTRCRTECPFLILSLPCWVVPSLHRRLLASASSIVAFRAHIRL